MPATKAQHQHAENEVQKVIDELLNEEIPSVLPGHTAYWFGVVIGGFVLSLGLVMLVAGG